MRIRYDKEKSNKFWLDFYICNMCLKNIYNKMFRNLKISEHKFLDLTFHYFIMKVLLYTIREMPKQNCSESQAAKITGKGRFFSGFALKVFASLLLFQK